MTNQNKNNVVKTNFVKKLVEKRIRGKVITSSNEEVPTYLSRALKASSQTIITFLILYLIFFPIPMSVILIFFFVRVLGQTIMTALDSYQNLTKLNTIIDEEKYEIEHHRSQERKELLTIYHAKGFSGKQLDEVVDVLMSDENRLLQVMIEEEMNIALGSYEHPVKDAFFVMLGILIPATIMFFCNQFLPKAIVIIVAGVIIAFISIYSSFLKKTNFLTPLIWSLSIATFLCSVCVFLKQVLMKF
jgi:vacuolar iron transporter family protein